MDEKLLCSVCKTDLNGAHYIVFTDEVPFCQPCAQRITDKGYQIERKCACCQRKIPGHRLQEEKCLGVSYIFRDYEGLQTVSEAFLYCKYCKDEAMKDKVKR